jgi:hypothetical protein
MMMEAFKTFQRLARTDNGRNLIICNMVREFLDSEEDLNGRLAFFTGSQDLPIGATLVEFHGFNFLVEILEDGPEDHWTCNAARITRLMREARTS